MLKRLDVQYGSMLAISEESFRLAERPHSIMRLENRTKASIDTYLQAQRTSPLQSQSVAWTNEEIRAPNISDAGTVLALAQMCNNAYIEIPGTEDWYDVTTGPYNTTGAFGWEEDGLRGRVYTDQKNETVIITIKGTSFGLFGNSATGSNDKTNDNLLFSCCCARVSYLWPTVCDCYTGTYSCNQTCSEESVTKEDRYYQAALNIYYNVSAMYPDADIWMSGHSLGGAMASLVGLTFGLPAVTFEAPGDRLPSERLHLPLPPGMPASKSAIWHFGHTADPIFMGVCNGPSSPCWLGGYAFESMCKTGLECVWDTVTDKGWRVSLRKHGISYVINEVVSQYSNVPTCVAQDDCVDCYNWNFSKGYDPPPKSTLLSSSRSIPLTTATPSKSNVTPTQTGAPKEPEKKCLKRNFLGWCQKWEDG